MTLPQSAQNVIVLDPGHGGKDSGAMGPSILFPWKGKTPEEQAALDAPFPRLKESDVVLDVCHRIKRMLEPYQQVAMTREGDDFIELSDRARFANKFPGAYFLSVHCNSARNPASGLEVFTSPGNTRSDPFATALFNSATAVFPTLKARKDLKDGDPDKEAKFTVLTATKGPAALFELEFIHTPAGDAFLRDEWNLQLYAYALAVAINPQVTRPRALHSPASPIDGGDEPDDLDPATSNLARARRKLTEALELLG